MIEVQEFLTHTVQIKLLSKEEVDKIPHKVLNPHGSDKTIENDTVIILDFEFLTHTVQIKLGRGFHYHPTYMMVLNPHGSDKTLNMCITTSILFSSS